MRTSDFFFCVPLLEVDVTSTVVHCLYLYIVSIFGVYRTPTNDDILLDFYDCSYHDTDVLTFGLLI